MVVCLRGSQIMHWMAIVIVLSSTDMSQIYDGFCNDVMHCSPCKDHPVRRLCLDRLAFYMTSNYEAFRECFSNVLIAKLCDTGEKRKKAVKGRKNEIKPVRHEQPLDEGNDVSELADTIDASTLRARCKGTPQVHAD